MSSPLGSINTRAHLPDSAMISYSDSTTITAVSPATPSTRTTNSIHQHRHHPVSVATTPSNPITPTSTTATSTNTTTSASAIDPIHPPPANYRGLPFPAWPALVRRSQDMPVTPPNGVASSTHTASETIASNGTQRDVAQYYDHSEEHPENRVQAYAKLEGENFCYFVQSLEVIIGRRTTNTDLVDVNLGAAKAVSRRHARIHYNMQEQRFEMTVFGKNGVFINEEFVACNTTVVLPHGTRIQVGETKFSFLLPENGQPGVIRDYPNGVIYVHRGITPETLNEQTVHNIENQPDMLINERGTHPLPSLSAAVRPVVRLAPRPTEPTTDESYLMNHGYGASTLTSPTSHMINNTSPKSPVHNTHILASTDRPNGSHEMRPFSSLTVKPPYSYASLIAQAINATPERKCTLAEIYAFISEQHPYYKLSHTGWQNSIRHNLSLNKAFVRVPRASHEPGKGAYWTIDPNCDAEFRNGIYKRKRMSYSKGASTSNTATPPQQQQQQQEHPQQQLTPSMSDYHGKSPVTPKYPARHAPYAVDHAGHGNITPRSLAVANTPPTASLSRDSPINTMSTEVVATRLNSNVPTVESTSTSSNHYYIEQQQQQQVDDKESNSAFSPPTTTATTSIEQVSHSIPPSYNHVPPSSATSSSSSSPSASFPTLSVSPLERGIYSEQSNVSMPVSPSSIKGKHSSSSSPSVHVSKGVEQAMTTQVAELSTTTSTTTTSTTTPSIVQPIHSADVTTTASLS